MTEVFVGFLRAKTLKRSDRNAARSIGLLRQMRDGVRFTHSNDWNVRSRRQLNINGVVHAGSEPILMQLLPQPACVDPDKRINSRVELFVSSEDIKTDGILVERVTFQRLVDEEHQELTKLFGARKCFARKDLFELGAHRLWRWNIHSSICICGHAPL